MSGSVPFLCASLKSPTDSISSAEDSDRTVVNRVPPSGMRASRLMLAAGFERASEGGVSLSSVVACSVREEIGSVDVLAASIALRSRSVSFDLVSRVVSSAFSLTTRKRSSHRAVEICRFADARLLIAFRNFLAVMQLSSFTSSARARARRSLRLRAFPHGWDSRPAANCLRVNTPLPETSHALKSASGDTRARDAIAIRLLMEASSSLT
jgi:hypothetical protein